MPLALVLFLVDATLVIHAAKSGRFWPWAYVILLLPGVCALIFAFAPHYDSFFTPFVVLGLIVSVFGVVMIRVAIRGPKR